MKCFRNTQHYCAHAVIVVSIIMSSTVAARLTVRAGVPAALLINVIVFFILFMVLILSPFKSGCKGTNNSFIQYRFSR